jgi:WD40 repeat protein
MRLQMAVLTLIVLIVFTGGLWAQENDQIYVTAVAWSHDGSKIAVVGIRQPMTQGYLRVVDVQTGEILYSVDPNPGGFTSVDWSPDDRFIAVGGYDQVVWVFDVEAQTHVTSLRGHQSTVSAVDWNAEGTQLVSTGNWDGLTILWDTTTYEQIRIVEEGSLFPLAVEFSPDGQAIAVGGEGGIRIYSTQSGLGQNPAWYFRELNVAALSWNHAGNRIAFGTQTFASITNPNRRFFAQLYVIDGDSGAQVNILPTDDSTIYGLDWSPDDRFIATYSIDGFVRLWEVETGLELDNFSGITRYPSNMMFSPYGGRLAYGTSIPGELSSQLGEQASAESARDSLVGGAVQIVVPSPSLERLQAIAEACNAPTVVEQELTASIQVDRLTEFVAQVEALPENTIPPACAADLIAMAAAIQSR